MLQVKQICKERGITLKDLASRMGITYQTLYEMLTGNPSLDSLKRISETLGVPLVRLFTESRDNVIKCPNCGALLELKELEQR